MKPLLFAFKNRKGMTLIEVMVVMIIIAAMVAMAYPSYLSSLEKARALEAVKVIANMVASQAKYRGEDHLGAATTYANGYASNFKALDVEITGKNKSSGKTTISDDGKTLDTPFFKYELSDSAIVATSKGARYDYYLKGFYSTGALVCVINADNDDGKKVCAALGKKVSGSSTEFRIE